MGWQRYVGTKACCTNPKYANMLVVQRSVMEIDDRWQSAYGDLTFDQKKFPDAKGMVDQLHEMGFKVTVWVMPFVEENSEAYRQAL